ncbi:Dabb family protein [uncultured Robinsoniella sp.]|uniref:Dabb family protein n=1 Tax=uncultured Robinsoniella sp. TaxID=904190 RepID=UPI00374FD0B5
MVKHIVLWNFVETMTAEEKKEAGMKMKSILEPLKDVIPGVISLQVVQNELDSSNRDIALIGEYESVEALNNYTVHPAHVEAGKFVRSVTCNRACLDF